jgi:prepilin-type N-terminal cleavage/methylation domain-containing protein
MGCKPGKEVRVGSEKGNERAGQKGRSERIQWEDVKMKKAFTLIELLVVIAIIAILAAMLMPALARARAEAQKATCKSNVRNTFTGLAIQLNDNDGVYPGWVSAWINTEPYFQNLPGGTTDTPQGPWAQLVMGGYVQGVDIFDCPSAKNFQDQRYGGMDGPKLLKERSGWGSFDDADPRDFVAAVEYAMDWFGVSRDSVPGRILYGDSWERYHWWQTAGGGYWPYNHPDGSNALCIDGAVVWAPLEHEDYNVRIRVNWGNWSRYGNIGNPRMDEDVQYAEAAGMTEAQLREPNDHDDIYGRERPGQTTWGEAGSGGTPYPGLRNNFGDAYGTSALAGEPVYGGVRALSMRAMGWSADPAHRHFFPQKGFAADEGRWDKYDAALFPGGSFMQPGDN